MKGIDTKYLPAVRWSIVRTLRVGGHLGATETMLMEVLRSEWMTFSQSALRSELHYLESRELIEVEQSEIDPWRARLSRHGYDLADYQIDCLPGIHRPPIETP